jgi:hypothetical protein
VKLLLEPCVKPYQRGSNKASVSDLGSVWYNFKSSFRSCFRWSSTKRVNKTASLEKCFRTLLSGAVRRREMLPHLALWSGSAEELQKRSSPRSPSSSALPFPLCPQGRGPRAGQRRPPARYKQAEGSSSTRRSR